MSDTTDRGPPAAKAQGGTFLTLALAVFGVGLIPWMVADKKILKPH